MSSVANRNAAANSSRFELPALDLNLGRITDGTDIPPPAPPPPPPDSEKRSMPATESTANESNGKLSHLNGHDKLTTRNGNGTMAGTKRPAEDVPLSPASPGRPGSLRRFFSRTMLNNTYAEGQPSENGNDSGSTYERPESRSAGSFMSERKPKRSSSWFRRFRIGDGASRRSSLMYEESSTPSATKRPSGPPPPMIPELAEFEKDEGSLGKDLFRNIK